MAFGNGIVIIGSCMRRVQLVPLKWFIRAHTCWGVSDTRAFAQRVPRLSDIFHLRQIADLYSPHPTATSQASRSTCFPSPSCAGS